MMSAHDEPFGQLTEEAGLYDLPDGDPEEILRPFEAGMVVTAGRAPGVMAYRDDGYPDPLPADRTGWGAPTR
jgi:hypothetical protein